MRDKIPRYRVNSVSRDLLKFWEISANVSEIVRDRGIQMHNGKLIGNHMCPIEWNQYQ